MCERPEQRPHVPYDGWASTDTRLRGGRCSPCCSNCMHDVRWSPHCITIYHPLKLELHSIHSAIVPDRITLLHVSDRDLNLRFGVGCCVWRRGREARGIVPPTSIPLREESIPKWPPDGRPKAAVVTYYCPSLLFPPFLPSCISTLLTPNIPTPPQGHSRWGRGRASSFFWTPTNIWMKLNSMEG